MASLACRILRTDLDEWELCCGRVHLDHEHALRNAMARFASTQNVEVAPDAALQSGDVLPYLGEMEQSDRLPWCGEVAATVGLLAESHRPSAAIDDFREVR